MIRLPLDPPAIDLERHKLLCPLDGGDVQRVIAARWKVVVPPKTLRRWVKCGLYIGRFWEFGQKTRPIRMKMPVRLFRRLMVTSREALELWMIQAERAQKLCKASRPVARIDPRKASWLERHLPDLIGLVDDPRAAVEAQRKLLLERFLPNGVMDRGSRGRSAKPKIGPNLRDLATKLGDRGGQRLGRLDFTPETDPKMMSRAYRRRLEQMAGEGNGVGIGSREPTAAKHTSTADDHCQGVNVDPQSSSDVGS